MISTINFKFNHIYTYKHMYDLITLRLSLILIGRKKMCRENEIRSNGQQSIERNVTLSHENTNFNINVLLY